MKLLITAWTYSLHIHWHSFTDRGAPGGPASVCTGGPQQAGAGQLPSAEPGTNESWRGGERPTAQSAQRAAGQRWQDEPVTETAQRQRDPTGLSVIFIRLMCVWVDIYCHTISQLNKTDLTENHVLYLQNSNFSWAKHNIFIWFYINFQLFPDTLMRFWMFSFKM